LKRQIIFVDDDHLFLEGMKRLLHKERKVWDMFFVTSADEALAEIQKNNIDVVISDINMPGKDGFALVSALHSSESTRDIQVIIMTGAGEEDLKRRALELGASDLLNKPVNREDLIARIRNTLRIKSYQQRLKEQNSLLEEKVNERTADLEKSRLDIIWHLAKAGEYRDDDTGKHVARVGCYSRLLAEHLGMPSDFVENIFLTSPLHDIGKIGISDTILLKNAKLSSDEWEIMRKHCVIGRNILLEEPKEPFLSWRIEHSIRESIDNPLLNMGSVIAMTHHERWDGSGYPQGLKGEEIPLESRIVAISDVYDALCSKRPYKEAYNQDYALSIMKEKNGDHFDPMVFACFEKLKDKFSEINTKFSDYV